MSKSKNQYLLKEKVDSLFETLKAVDGINLRFFKRYASLRIFEVLYTSSHPYCTSCFIDTNLIAFPGYKDTDFIKLQKSTMMEQYLEKNHLNFLN